MDILYPAAASFLLQSQKFDSITGKRAFYPRTLVRDRKMVEFAVCAAFGKNDGRECISGFFLYAVWPYSPWQVSFILAAW